MKQKTLKKTFNEGYEVEYTFINKEGYHRNDSKIVYVVIEHGVNEKNNHEAAKEKFLELADHLSIKIFSVNKVIYL